MPLMAWDPMASRRPSPVPQDVPDDRWIRHDVRTRVTVFAATVTTPHHLVASYTLLCPSAPAFAVSLTGVCSTTGEYALAQSFATSDIDHTANINTTSSDYVTVGRLAIA